MQDKKTLKRINQLIQDSKRNGCMGGIGKPEPFSGNLQGEYNRRINEKDRLVYHMEDGRLYIAHCRGHYGKRQPKPTICIANFTYHYQNTCIAVSFGYDPMYEKAMSNAHIQ